MLQQRAEFDDFIAYHDQERPHQALDMKYPAELYRPSARPARGRSMTWINGKSLYAARFLAIT